jgi:hypothetical protein
VGCSSTIPYSKKTTGTTTTTTTTTTIIIIIIIIITSKSFRKYLSNIPGKHDIKVVQNTAVLGTALIIRKVLM